MDSFCFNEEYLRRLQEGDACVENHFSAYFGELIIIKLRQWVRAPQLIEDIRQETFLRVLRAVRSGTTIGRPEGLGSFVNSVCNNVAMELLRSETRLQQFDDGKPDPPDEHSLEAALITRERKREVKRVLARLPEADRKLLKRLFYEGKEKAEICRELNVDPGYLRVLLFRAKARFKQRFARYDQVRAVRPK